ncbi:Fur family transcriptional regulator [Lignipirellula cremea]|nr:transcriptional repressor [Lignipirellula cremea]
MSIDAARQLVRKAGLRATPARLLVMQCLAGSSRPLSHLEVCEQIGDRGFDPSTIYRSLTELSEAGVLARLDVDSTRRFEYLSDEAQSGEHPHFLCVDCGKMACLEGYSFRLTPRKSASAPVGEITQVLVKGHCVECK